MTESELIEEAREWIRECTWGDLYPEGVDALLGHEIKAGVRRHYGGGWEQFAADAEAIKPFH